MVLAVDVVAVLVTVLFVPATSAVAIELYLVVAAISAFAVLLKSATTPGYTFDGRGVYSGRGTLFTWGQVKRIKLNFKEHEVSSTVAVPTWDALISGGPIQRAEYVGYGAGIAFTLEDGKVVSIQSSLNQLTDGGIIERIDEAARAANPKIEFA